MWDEGQQYGIVANYMYKAVGNRRYLGQRTSYSKLDEKQDADDEKRETMNIGWETNSRIAAVG